MSLPAALPEAGAGLPATVDRARQALAEAKTDFERLKVRDHAKALEAAAEILKRKDIQVEASLLVTEAERAIAKANPPKVRGAAKKNSVPRGHTISSDTVRKARQAHDRLTDDQFEDVKRQAREQGQPVTRQALKDLVRKKHKAEQIETRQYAQAAAAKSAPIDDERITCCAVADYHRHVAAGSVDAIVTDPPYLLEHVHLYGDLAKLAVHALRPGGLLLCIAAHPHLLEILNLMHVDGLRYRWIIAYCMQGATQQVHSAKVTVQFKPILAFTRAGGHPDGYSTDRIEVGPYSAENKRVHIWGQSVPGMTALIKEWARRPSLICDPFVGAGSSLVAAQRLGHRVIGADVDAGWVQKTKEALR